MHLRTRDRTISFPRPALVMGIVNANDDSFSGDGTQGTEAAIELATQHIQAGADIIDVGAESARTDRTVVSPAVEIDRLAPFVEAFWKLPDPPLLSVNTWRPEVVKEILPMGVDILNDIGALPDDTNARLCAATGTALIIMHSVGEPKQRHTGRRYADIISELETFFTGKLELAASAGLDPSQTLLDPGIDFAKDRTDNLRIYRELEQLAGLGRPLLLPVSRKTVVGDVLGIEEPAARDAGSLACSVSGILRGASVLRVHNVAATKAAVLMLAPLLDPAVPAEAGER